MPAKQIYRFGPFVLDPEERLLLRGGNPVSLTPKAFETLLALVENGGHVVKKDDLMRRIWPDSFVEEANLAQNISVVRRALDVDGEEQYIETVPKLGYRLVVNVVGVPPEKENPAFSPLERTAYEIYKTEPKAGPVVATRGQKRKLIAAVSVASLVILAGLAWRLSVRTAKPAVHITSLAVLPLENLSRDQDQEYFADGITDELITNLAKIHSLRVISRNSVMQFKGKHQPIPQIARALNVDAIVEGTVTHAGDRVRITAQLIAAREDRHLWADSYEGDLRNILTLQDEVTTAIANQISVQLTPQERVEFGHARAVDPQAHQAYLRGIYELRSHTAESQTKAIEYFQRAIAIDPNDPLPYEGLAVAYIVSDGAPTQYMPKARAAALKAIELDDSLADAHSSLGLVKLVFDWDWKGAEQELRKALELNPNSPRAHTDYARYLLLVPHRVDEGIQNVRTAYDLDPAIPELDDLIGYLFFSGRYQAAIDEADRELKNNSPFLALAYAASGRPDKAVAVADRAVATTDNPADLPETASAYGLAGDKRRANAVLARILAQGHQHYLCGMRVAAVYSVLGEKDNAMAWLEKAYRDRSV